MTWNLDKTHSAVTIAAKHMMLTTVRGTLEITDLDVEFDPAAPERSRVAAVLDAASISTGVEQRDAHLRSPDFLDAETYPTIAFASTGIERRGSDWSIRGDLTIRGATHPIELHATLGGIVPDLRGGRRAAISARARIPRERWGLTWNVAIESGGWLVSKELDVEIELALLEAAVEEGARAAAA